MSLSMSSELVAPAISSLQHAACMRVTPLRDRCSTHSPASAEIRHSGSTSPSARAAWKARSKVAKAPSAIASRIPAIKSW